MVEAWHTAPTASDGPRSLTPCHSGSPVARPRAALASHALVGLGCGAAGARQPQPPAAGVARRPARRRHARRSPSSAPGSPDSPAPTCWPGTASRARSTRPTPDRLGGRCWTSRGWAHGQTAEHGGEFIDTVHHSHPHARGRARAGARRPARAPRRPSAGARPLLPARGAAHRGRGLRRLPPAPGRRRPRRPPDRSVPLRPRRPSGPPARRAHRRRLAGRRPRPATTRCSPPRPRSTWPRSTGSTSTT